MASQDISTILSTNNVPTETQLATLELHKSNIAYEQSLLRSKLQALETKMEQYRGATSPIRRLPLELIGEILYYASPSPISESNLVDLENLCLVCKRWNEAARSMPKLRSSLNIAPLKSKSFELVVPWWKRFNSSSRSLTWDGPDCRCSWENQNQEEPDEEWDGEPCRCIHPVLLELLKDGPRIDDFTLMPDSHQCLVNFLDAMKPAQGTSSPRTWDTIKTLTFDFRDENGPWRASPDAPSNTDFLHLPPVTTLRLFLPPSESVFDESYEAYDVSLNIPPEFLRGLKSFEMRCDWDGIHVFKALKDCVEVESVYINYCQTTDFTFPARDVDFLNNEVVKSGLILPKMKKLHIRAHPGHCVWSFIVSPVLTHLDLDYSAPNRWADLRTDWKVSKELTRYMQLANCRDTLRVVCLRNLTISEDELKACLLALPPGLTHLTLDNMNTKYWLVFTALQCSISLEDKVPLPNLEVLELLRVREDMWGGRMIMWPLSMFIELRKKKCEVRVSFQTSLDPEGPHAKELLEEYMYERETEGIQLGPGGSGSFFTLLPRVYQEKGWLHLL